MPIPMLALGALKNWKVIAGGFAALAIVTTIGLAYWHYTGLLGTIEELKVSNKQLELSYEIQQGTIAQQEKAIGQWQEAQAELKKKYEELSKVTYKASKETRRLNDLFSKHDLGKLAARKPGLIQRRINSGTKSTLRLFECETAGTCNK